MAVEKVRKMGKDFRREYKELTNSLESLKIHVDSRLRTLINLYPNAVINDKTKASDLLDIIEYIGNDTVEEIEFIVKIEKWSEEQQGVVQLKI